MKGSSWKNPVGGSSGFVVGDDLGAPVGSFEKEGFLGFVVGDNLGTPCVSLKRIPWKDLRFSCGV